RTAKKTMAGAYSRATRVIPLPVNELPASLDELLSNDDPNQIYSNFKKIGEGAAGQVFVAVDTRTGRKVAVKKMELDEDNTKLIMGEIHIMRSCNHPNIIDYVDS